MLVANLGNTHLRLVYFEGGAIAWDVRIPTGEVAREHLPTLPPHAGVVLVSVVPALAEQLLEHWQAHEPWLLKAECLADLPIAYQPPGALGADRVANALYLKRRFGSGVVVDAGTATTLTLIDRAGVLRGGAIMPGLGTARSSLVDRTAQLPAVPLEPVTQAWGESTVASIQVGLVQGHVGAIAHLVSRMREGLPADAPVLLTGGWSTLLAPLLGNAFVHLPDLTIEGARLAWQEARG